MVTDEAIEKIKQTAREAFMRMPLPGLKHPSDVADGVAEAIGAAGDWTTDHSNSPTAIAQSEACGALHVCFLGVSLPRPISL